VTVATPTLADSYTGVGIFSERASRDGRVKKIGIQYASLTGRACLVQPLAMETLGPINLVSTTLDRFAAFQRNFAA